MRRVEHVVVGAGPGGLRAAEVLALAGREVLVLERSPVFGDKVCAGGLTTKAADLLARMGLPDALCRRSLAHGSFLGEDPIPLDPRLGRVRTLSRRALGEWQVGVTRAAGAAVRAGASVVAVDLGARSITLDGGETIGWEHLIGADGSRSLVRRALGLSCSRRYFAAEYNVPGDHEDRLLILLDSRSLAQGYFWAFPQVGYTSFGCGADRTLVSPRAVCRYLRARLAKLGVSTGDVPLEGALIEVGHAGVHFGRAHLVGDAAGLASPVTGEGIYAALASGEDVARRLLDPGWPQPLLRGWQRTRALHGGIARLWRHEAARTLSYHALRALCRHPFGRRAVTGIFAG
ncbi:MAG: NAD(P)/FAD-dependent oxidoreductase [Armatimonadetes bacterium]|nr:NAD(P)/FAD-dependent oxidoreductase [Armatimonadota bacterium]